MLVCAWTIKYIFVSFKLFYFYFQFFDAWNYGFSDIYNTVQYSNLLTIMLLVCSWQMAPVLLLLTFRLLAPASMYVCMT